MRRRITTPLAAVAALALLLTGCGDRDDGATTPTDGDGAFPVTVGDLTLTEQPTRIVSLSPTVTEMLFAIDAGGQVVAVDEFSTYPPEAPTTELSGFDLNPEAVASYDPDLVIISSFADSIVPQLGELGIPVYVAPDNPTSMDDVYRQITELGLLTGRVDEAADLVTRMSEDIAKITADAPARTEPLTYYIEIDDTYWTYTSGSIVGSLFELIGLRNIAEDQSSVTTQLSAEAIIDANPDLILLTNADFGVTAEVVAERDGWSGIQAVQTGQIIEVDPDIASRWGPRLVDLLATVADAVAQVP
jgi:iron complex transport system substrate-binding protein